MWITFIHIVLFLVSVSVYGIAPIGVEVKDVSKEVSLLIDLMLEW